jgi:hypothetical protein
MARVIVTPNTRTGTRRQIAIRKPVVVQNAAAVEGMKATLDDIISKQALIAKLTAEVSQLETGLEQEMRSYGLTELKGSQGAAGFVAQKSNDTRTIKPEEFRELVSDEEFLACVKVVKERAEKYVSGKELESVTETVKGKAKPAKFTVSGFSAKKK